MNLPTTPGPIDPPPMGYLAAKILEDGRIVCLIPLTLGRARIIIGQGWISYETGW